MKNKLFYLLVPLFIFTLWACSEDDLDRNSIFSSEEVQRNDFDKWLLKNYTEPYNVNFMYRLTDIETNTDYHLAPAELDKSIKLAKLIKHVWIEVYDSIAGEDFLKTYIPRVMHAVGSSAYNDNGTMVLGTAEGGMKITLYNVNGLTDVTNITFLNTYFFHTMHHEFAHILHQTKKYDVEFQLISEENYVSGDWYLNRDYLNQGFVTAYSSSSADEDFVEVISNFVTMTPDAWDSLLASASATGRAIIEQKFEIVYNYMLNSWDIDLYELRAEVQEKVRTIPTIDFDTL